jgi:hypothetical protein
MDDKVAKFRGGFADNQQAIFGGADRLISLGKTAKVHPRRKPFDGFDIVDDVAENAESDR